MFVLWTHSASQASYSFTNSQLGTKSKVVEMVYTCCVVRAFLCKRTLVLKQGLSCKDVNSYLATLSLPSPQAYVGLY